MGEEKKSYFWELVLSNIMGTATGCIIAYYATAKKNIDISRYLDRGIDFLEGVKKRTKPPGYRDE